MNQQQKEYQEAIYENSNLFPLINDINFELLREKLLGMPNMQERNAE